LVISSVYCRVRLPCSDRVRPAVSASAWSVKCKRLLADSLSFFVESFKSGLTIQVKSSDVETSFKLVIIILKFFKITMIVINVIIVVRSIVIHPD
jgi:hypothetical protein